MSMLPFYVTTECPVTALRMSVNTINPLRFQIEQISMKRNDTQWELYIQGAMLDETRVDPRATGPIKPPEITNEPA